MNKIILESLLTQIQEHCRKIESHQHVIRNIVGTITEKIILDDEEITPEISLDTATGKAGAKDGEYTQSPCCKTCGNIKKAVTKIKGGYYCNGCQNDLMPDNIQPGEAVKRKFCFKCSNRLPGFFKVEDTSPVWCEKCTGEI